MIVAFHADDASASHAALLTAGGLAAVDRPATLLQVVHSGSDALAIPPRASPINVVRVDARLDPFPLLRRLLAQAAETDRDVLLAAPLRLMATAPDKAVNPLRVLPIGASPTGTAATLRALGEANNAGSAPTGDRDRTSGSAAPHWLLPRVGHDNTLAAGDASHGQLALESTNRTRLLPIAMRTLRRPEAVALLEGDPAPSVLRRAILLAAVLEALAADPLVDRLDRGTLAGMLDPTLGHADPHVRGRLVALADRFDVVPTPGRSAGAASRVCHPSGAMWRHPTVAVRPLQRRAAAARRPGQGITGRNTRHDPPAIMVGAKLPLPRP